MASDRCPARAPRPGAVRPRTPGGAAGLEELDGEVVTLAEVCLGARAASVTWDGVGRSFARHRKLVVAAATLVLSVPAAIYGGRGMTRPESRKVAALGGAVTLAAATGALARRGA